MSLHLRDESNAGHKDEEELAYIRRTSITWIR